MQFSTLITGTIAAAATLAAAAPALAPAPATEKRGVFDAASFNNLAFGSVNLGYLNVINSLDLQLLQQLAISNNFNAVAFQQLFSSNSFSVQNLLELQQLQTLLQLGQLGVFNQFDLGSLQLQSLQLGLIQNVGGFDLGSLIDASLVPQITTIVQQGGMSLLPPPPSTCARGRILANRVCLVVPAGIPTGVAPGVIASAATAPRN